MEPRAEIKKKQDERLMAAAMLNVQYNIVRCAMYEQNTFRT